MRDPGLHARFAAPVAARGLTLPLAHPPGRDGTGDDPQGDPFAPLLLAAAPCMPTPPRLRERLLARVAASAAAGRAMHTRRHAGNVQRACAAGVTMRELYRAGPAPQRRPGEPEGAWLVEFAPHARWAFGETAGGVVGEAAPDTRFEWLVLQGGVVLEHEIDGKTPLQAHDYHVRHVRHSRHSRHSRHRAQAHLARPEGAALAVQAGAAGALLYLRTACDGVAEAPVPYTQRADVAEWLDYAPGIRRRLMWRQGAQAAMLYHALPGAAVPHHGHGHDEECLMLAGDFFLDEVLLRPLDYQLAPAGSAHRVSATDTGVVIFAHGDVELAMK